MRDRQPPPDQDPGEWFAPRTVSAAPVLTDRDPATGPHPITGDMATAFETGRQQGFEAGYAAGYEHGHAAGEADGRRAGHQEALGTLLAVYRARFGNDGNIPTFVNYFRDALAKL